jgi:small-conductance mechanosensitive channel
MASFNEIIQHLQIGTVFRAILLLVLGYVVAKIVGASVKRASRKYLSDQQSILLSRVLFYTVFFLFLASGVQQLGFNIGALLGATGILTIALGIASQTSMSNLVSGIFIIGEKPFQIGDTIKVNDIQGEVVSIDSFSAKIRTTDNTMVRVPNEILIKSAISNTSYFPIRRIDLNFYIPFTTDIEQVKNVFLSVAEKNSLCLKEPKPAFAILSFAYSSVQIQLSVWCKKENYNELKTTMYLQIKNVFPAKIIEQEKDK